MYGIRLRLIFESWTYSSSSLKYIFLLTNKNIETASLSSVTCHLLTNTGNLFGHTCEQEGRWVSSSNIVGFAFEGLHGLTIGSNLISCDPTAFYQLKAIIMFFFLIVFFKRSERDWFPERNEWGCLRLLWIDFPNLSQGDSCFGKLVQVI